MRRRASILILTSALALAGAACDGNAQDDLDQIEENIDEGVNDVGEGISNVGDELQDGSNDG